MFIVNSFFGEEVPSRGKYVPMLTDAYGSQMGTELEMSITQNPEKYLADQRPLVAKIAREICDAVERSKSSIGPVARAFAGIYDKLDGVHWKVDDGWSIYDRHQPLGTWYGVTTDPNSANIEMVTSVKLVGNRLKGQMSDVLSVLGDAESRGNCAFLEINVASNQLRGPLRRRDIAKFSNIVVFCANFNRLEGELYGLVIGQYWTNLTVLALQQNLFSGPLPSFSEQCCPHLRILHLYDNHFEGELPESFSELSQLEELRLWKNKLTGKIPPSYGKLKKLKILHLAGNMLTGPIPKQLGDCDQLEHLYLHDNKLQGNIPMKALFEISNIQTIALRGNKMLSNLAEFETEARDHHTNICYLSSDVGGAAADLFEWSRESAEAKEYEKECD
jgi:hypothetical protein